MELPLIALEAYLIIIWIVITTQLNFSYWILLLQAEVEHFA